MQLNKKNSYPSYKMSFQVQSSDLASVEEVLPNSVRTGLTRSSLILERRTCRVTPSTGQTIGTVSSASGAGGQQVSFLLSGQGGMIVPQSVRLNYYETVSGTTGPAVPDDGHFISQFQVTLNSQPLDMITNAAKLTNMEMTLAGSKGYYQTAGSFQGFALLSDDLNSATPTATPTLPMLGRWGFVANNVADIQAHHKRLANAVTGNNVGAQKSIPLSLVSGVFRMQQALPDMLGDLAVTFTTLSAAERVFNASASATGDYAISGMNIEYEVLVLDPRYQEVLRKTMSDPSDGIMLAYESSILASAGAISGTVGASLTENTLVVSRATTNLVRSSVAFVNAAAISSVNYPGQSCFSHAGVYSCIWRAGSRQWPNFPATGDASLFNLALGAYGSCTLESGSITNRALWASSTDPSAAGTAAVLESALGSTSGTSTTKFAYADRFVLANSFRNLRAIDEIVDYDGINLSAASGAQLQIVLQMAPQANYIPFVSLVAIRTIKASGGSVVIVGA